MPALATSAATVPVCKKALVHGWHLAVHNSSHALSTNVFRSPIALQSARLMSSEALASKRYDGDQSAENTRSAGINKSSDQKSTTGDYVPVPFTSYDSIDKMTMKALTTRMGFTVASKVQDQILSRMPIENDIIVKAKTGTGKTVAFLIAAISSLIRAQEANPEAKRKGRSVGCLVVSPTRELAHQLAAEALKVVQFHKWGVQLLVGGESTRYQSDMLSRGRSDIVIGTPGRINDFLLNNPEFADLASRTQVLVLDEADLLLDMGFTSEIDDIVSRLPPQRQTFLVSATINPKVKTLARNTFNRGFDLIDCVDKNDVNTHAHIKQEYIQAEPCDHFPVLCDIIQSHIDKNTAENQGSKIVVFLPTVKGTATYAKVIGSLMKKGRQYSDNRVLGGYRRGNQRNDRRGGRGSGSGFDSVGLNPFDQLVDISCLHGKIDQRARTRISDSFRAFPATVNKTAILFTTDVSARGVDYPGISLVIQVGVPSDPEAYIHRLGRTGRAGKGGEGVAIYSKIELPFLKHDVTKSLVKNEEYTPEYIASIANLDAGAAKKCAERWERCKQTIDSYAVSDTVNSLIAYYEAKKSIIGGPSLKSIAEVAYSTLVPFNIERPSLPRFLREAMDSDERKQERRNSRRGSGNRGSGSRNFGGDRSNRFETRGFGGDRSDRAGNQSFGDRGGNRGYGGDRSGSRSFGNNQDNRNRSFGSGGGGPRWMTRGKVNKR
ncbi:hypothetical protein EV175_002209 [Coemansia sp. RSA 1933]|nr:hypothetical protein EV175_002209 [Coemansia sp. RSA 1933]